MAATAAAAAFQVDAGRRGREKRGFFSSPLPFFLPPFRALRPSRLTSTLRASSPQLLLVWLLFRSSAVSFSTAFKERRETHTYTPGTTRLTTHYRRARKYTPGYHVRVSPRPTSWGRDPTETTNSGRLLRRIRSSSTTSTVVEACGRAGVRACTRARARAVTLSSRSTYQST